MKNKLFFTLVIALMSIYATATETRLHPVLKYKTINGKKTNYSEAELKAMLLDKGDTYDAAQDKVRELITPQLKAQGVDVAAIPEAEWEGVYERCVQEAHLSEELTFAPGDYVIFGKDDQGQMGTIKPRGNYPGERKLYVDDFRKVCPSVQIPAKVDLCSAMCGNALYKSTLTNLITLMDETDPAASKNSQTTKGTTETDEDGSSNATATGGTVNIYQYQQESAPAQTQYQNYSGYPTAAGYCYPTTYARQCCDYRPSCYAGSGFGFSLSASLSFGFHDGYGYGGGNGACGQNYNPPPIQTVNNIYNDNSYWSYYNHVQNTTINYLPPVTPRGWPVEPVNGDVLAASGWPTSGGNKGLQGATFEPLHSTSGQGGKYANETVMVSPRQKGETGITSPVSNTHTQAPDVVAPRKENTTFTTSAQSSNQGQVTGGRGNNFSQKENVTFTEVVPPRFNPAQVKTPEAPRGNVINPRTENVTAFNGGDVAPRNTPRETNPRANVTPKNPQRENVTANNGATRSNTYVPRNTTFNQSGNGNTASVQPKRNDGRVSGVNQNNTSRQNSSAQPQGVQPRVNQQPQQTRSQYQNSPQVRQPAQQKVQSAPRVQYARQNNSRPAVQSTGMRNTGRPVAMNSGGRRK